MARFGRTFTLRRIYRQPWLRAPLAPPPEPRFRPRSTVLLQAHQRAHLEHARLRQRPAFRRAWLNIPPTVIAGSGIKPMRHDGSVVGIIVRMKDARVTGSATFEVTVNDVKIGLTVTIDATNPQQASASQAQGLDVFSTGARIGVVATTAGFDPVAGNVPLVFVEVVEDLTT